MRPVAPGSMSPYNDGMQDEDALATLAWLIEAGADEATAETPVNRLATKPAAPAPVTPMPAAPRPAAIKSPASAGDPIGDALAAAAASNSLDELKAAMEAFEGSA